MSPVRIAWFSPLDFEEPGSSGTISAYFTTEALPRLSDRFEVELFSTSARPYLGYETRHYLSCFSRHREKPFDLFFYQVEDHLASDFCRAHLGLLPGVTVFHHLLARLPGPEPLAFSPWAWMRRTFRETGRSWPDRFEAATKQTPLLEREAGLSFLPIFTSPRNFSEFRRSIPQTLGTEGNETPGYYLPFPISPLAAKTGSKEAPFTVAFQGTPAIEHRAHKLLQAISRHPEVSLEWVIDSSERAEAEELLKEFGVHNATLHIGRSPAKWRKIVAGADLAVHTLFSVFGALGPYLEISMTAGVPCIVTRFAGGEEFPDKFVLKIPPGDFEVERLEAAIRGAFEEFPGGPARAAFAREEQEYARELHDPQAVVSELEEIFIRQSQRLSDLRERWAAFEREAKEAVLDELVRNRRTIAGESPFLAEICDERLFRRTFRDLGWSS